MAARRKLSGTVSVVRGQIMIGMISFGMRISIGSGWEMTSRISVGTKTD